MIMRIKQPSSLQDYFDLACKALKLKLDSIEDAEQDGYEMNQTIYPAYKKKEEWESDLKQMRDNYEKHFNSYNNGNGGELKKTNTPPKMASYGSSSRFIYYLLRDVQDKDITFEAKRETGFNGAPANLDAYIAHDNEDIYIEAKCREIYGSVANEFPYESYKDLIEELKDLIEVDKKVKGETKTVLKILNVKSKKDEADIKLKNFDLKQMVCHLCGIARWQLGITSKPTVNPYAHVRFIYLVYNPEELEGLLEQGKNKIKKIIEKYKDEIDIANDKIGEKGFKEIYKTILEFFKKKEKSKLPDTEIDTAKMAENFSFQVRCQGKTGSSKFDDCIKVI